MLMTHNRVTAFRERVTAPPFTFSKEVTGSSETSVRTCRTTVCQIPRYENMDRDSKLSRR